MIVNRKLLEEIRIRTYEEGIERLQYHEGCFHWGVMIMLILSMPFAWLFFEEEQLSNPSFKNVVSWLAIILPASILLSWLMARLATTLGLVTNKREPNKEWWRKDLRQRLAEKVIPDALALEFEGLSYSTSETLPKATTSQRQIFDLLSSELLSMDELVLSWKPIPTQPIFCGVHHKRELISHDEYSSKTYPAQHYIWMLADLSSSEQGITLLNPKKDWDFKLGKGDFFQEHNCEELALEGGRELEFVASNMTCWTNNPAHAQDVVEKLARWLFDCSLSIYGSYEEACQDELKWNRFRENHLQKEISGHESFDRPVLFAFGHVLVLDRAYANFLAFPVTGELSSKDYKEWKASMERLIQFTKMASMNKL